MRSLAEEIYNLDKNIILLYAFNATGKTRLSVAYKDHTKSLNENNHSGVYYNAFSEDLFTWHNDEENNNENIRLNIQQSSLNQYHQYLTEDAVLEKLEPYKPKYKLFFNTVDPANPELGIGSVSFSINGDEKQTPIKISRGEERIFVWCFFLALFEVQGWADVQNTHFFIDDPVSSLDDHNIFITADLLLKFIEKHCDNRKIIITTHHMGIFSILQDWLSKGENASKFKTEKITEKRKQEDGKDVIIREKTLEPKYIIRFIENKNGKLKFVGKKNGVHQYHLLLLILIKESLKTGDSNTYHFALLRQVLECIASFLGEGRFSYVLDKLDFKDANRKTDIINALSHEKIYNQKLAILAPDNKELLQEVCDAIITKFSFSI